MKAEELIKNNALQNIEVEGKQKVIFEEIAITAVRMARIEERERAYRALEYSLRLKVSSDYAKCFLDDFKEKMDANK